MFANIRDPGMAKGFSILANVFGAPDAKSAIQADLWRGQRDKMGAETALLQQKLAQAREAHANSVMLQSRLADPEFDFANPAHRRDLMSILAGVDGGLEHGPGFAMGSGSFVNPEFIPEESDFSRALLGTGVVNGWGNTPAGHRYETDMGARTSGRSTTPLDVSPQDVANLQQILQLRVQQMLAAQGADVTEVNPAVYAALMPRITQAYQQTRDAELAVAQVLQGLPFEIEDYVTEDGWFWDSYGKRATLPAHALTPTPAPGATPMVPAPAGAPPATADNPGAAGGAPTPVAPGAPKPVGTIGYTRDGRKVQKQADGTWVPVQ